LCNDALDRAPKGRDHWGTVKASVLPTLPSFPALNGTVAERPALLAGLMFVEGATTGWALKDLVAWFTAHGASMGRKAPPASVCDGVVGAIALTPGARLVGDRVARADDLPKLLAMARWRVVVTLRGLLAQPCDDRFLTAAIHADRVRRERGAWLAQPRDTDMLSDVVLSLFAVDVLSHRDFHDQNLCVCDVCGRISYNPAATTRAGCGDHVPRTDHTSGWDAKRPRSSLPPPPEGRAAVVLPFDARAADTPPLGLPSTVARGPSEPVDREAVTPRR
jgi:hypothetical protein